MDKLVSIAYQTPPNVPCPLIDDATNSVHFLSDIVPSMLSYLRKAALVDKVEA
jgi:hypothetical protein